MVSLNIQNKTTPHEKNDDAFSGVISRLLCECRGFT